MVLSCVPITAPLRARGPPGAVLAAAPPIYIPHARVAGPPTSPVLLPGVRLGFKCPPHPRDCPDTTVGALCPTAQSLQTLSPCHPRADRGHWLSPALKPSGSPRVEQGLEGPVPLGTSACSPAAWCDESVRSLLPRNLFGAINNLCFYIKKNNLNLGGFIPPEVSAKLGGMGGAPCLWGSQSCPAPSPLPGGCN